MEGWIPPPFWFFFLFKKIIFAHLGDIFTVNLVKIG